MSLSNGVPKELRGGRSGVGVGPTGVLNGGPKSSGGGHANIRVGTDNNNISCLMTPMGCTRLYFRKYNIKV